MIAPTADPLTRIGERYRLTECVRVDGARQCWRAVDELLRRPVRVWLYRDLDLAAAAELRRRLQTLHSVRHTGLVRVYDLVDHDDEVAVVTEAGPARVVADLLRAGERPSLGTVRGIISALAEVLDGLHLLGHTVSSLDARDLLLQADGVAILDAAPAPSERPAPRPDIHALQELARALVLGIPPRPDVPAAARLAVDRLSGTQDRFRSARDFAGNLASAISFDDRTEVLPRERWIALRRAAAERSRARALAGAIILTVSLAGGGMAATATTRPAERDATRPAPVTAAFSAPAMAARAIAAPAASAATAAAVTAAAKPVPVTGARGTAPSVIGLARDDAAAALLAAGAGSVTWRVDPKAKGVTRVVRQDPPAGQPLPRGVQATLYLDSASAR